YARADHRSLLDTVRVGRAAAGPGIGGLLWPGLLTLWLMAIGLAAWSWRPRPRSLAGAEGPAAGPPQRRSRALLPPLLPVGLPPAALLLYVGVGIVALRQPNPGPANVTTPAALLLAALPVCLILSLIWSGRLLLALLASLSVGLLGVSAVRAESGPALVI